MAIEAELSALIERTVSRDEVARLTLFADRLFARASGGLGGAEEQLAVARAAFEFFRVRAAPIAVRVLPLPDGAILVETVMADRPFIVDSLLEYYRSLGAAVRRHLHPVLRVARGSDGGITSLEQAKTNERAESFTHAELEVAAPPPEAEIAAAVESILDEVGAATGDFQRMTERALAICDETVAVRELVEVRDFLRWLVKGGFVFLGYCRLAAQARDGERMLTVERGSELGVLRDARARFGSRERLENVVTSNPALLLEGPALVIAKARAESWVHRRAPMDTVTIRRADARGRVSGFDHFIGLFTLKAYTEDAERIPVVRAKLAEVLAAEGAAPGSHDYKEIVAALQSFPRDELFRAAPEELRAQLRVILGAPGVTGARLTILPDPARGHVIALVVMPRESFSAAVRQQIQNAIARRLGGEIVYYYLALGEGDTARLHFCFAAPASAATAVRALEEEVAELARSWDDRLRDALERRLGAARGRALAARWAAAFTAEYRAATGAERAAADVERAEQLLGAGGGFTVEIVEPSGAQPAAELRMIGLGEAPALSELMPTLQNFGIAVLSEDVHVLAPAGRPERLFIAAFRVEGPGGSAFLSCRGAALAPDAITAVRDGRAEDDALNALTLTAGLEWREVALMRAYLAAAYQMRLAPARPALRRVFLAHPALARVLVDLFEARLDPDRPFDQARVDSLRAAYLERVEAVESITDDRIARALLSMVEATVRTNYFCPPAAPPRTVLKFASKAIAGLAGFAPLYEIHVNSTWFEGCHLRSGMVARGGIRISDRPDDYRTEILGLMKTQNVKNAIIVPVGAKGGFVVKPRRGRASGSDDAAQAYEHFIDALLEVTSNVVDGELVTPARVRVLDDDGAYLVVAADKGTAGFSDLANQIASRRGFWLGDAFASGGRTGYDHKRMGITARGAWESARHHLREMGRDPELGPPISMLGIGDMSGDVFGNGMLRSQNVKLVAAFDHRHIFVDPAPDCAKSFAERRRLFELRGSSWSDYDPALISAGGGVWPRGQKRIELSPEARAVLGCADEALDGESLIRAILRAPADLLFNGGIGTFVRASTETDAEVDDRANDSCRVTAAELRARVVVEGGNLGLTQRARIEYALLGGRINTDAIDNSAGVDTSDHEVNLKILMQPAMTQGRLAPDERDRLLAAARDEVAEQVLGHNRDQVISLSLEHLRSRTLLADFRDHMQALEEAGVLRRSDEALPSREELRDRRARFPGLTRPELAVLTAYAKIDLVRRLEATTQFDDPYLLANFLRAYFPRAIADRFADDIALHRLRREICATEVVNALVDLMGVTFVPSLLRDFGLQASEAIRAWIVADGILRLRERAARIKADGARLSADAMLSALLALERAARRASEWAVTSLDPASPIGGVVDRCRAPFERLCGEFDGLLKTGERARLEERYRELRAAVGDGDLADELARLEFAGHLLNVLNLAFTRGAEVRDAAGAYFGLSEFVDFGTLETAARSIAGDDRWERRAARDLAGDVARARLALCAAVLGESEHGIDAAMRTLRNRRAERLRELDQTIAEFRALSSPSLAALQVAVRVLGRLAHAP